jgi:hypothetical protein
MDASAAPLRADALPCASPYQRAGRIVVDASPGSVFDVLADPAQHAVIDGSGSVQGRFAGPSRLSLGATFGMDMRIVLPYRIRNTVVEFDEGRVIAWRHINGHRWRYELTGLPDAQGNPDARTEVVETFDGTTARIPASLMLIGAYDRNQMAILKTLVRLKKHVETGSRE